VQALRGAPITIYGNGDQTRSFGYVSDTVNGLLGLIDVEGIAGEVINLGNPAETTVRQFAETVVALTGSRSTIEFKPLPIDDPTKRQPDIAKARRLLGWEPVVALEEGLRHTLAYFSETLAGVAQTA
jgi:UDP-glucuronate decarboxylase